MTGIDTIGGLRALVLKRGVALGGLPRAEQDLALAWVWAGLAGSTMSEPQVNEALRQQLAGAAAFLATDHVELRRWLVDGGWLQRDGFGREYRRVAGDALPGRHRALADKLAGIDTHAWAEAEVRREAARRQARRAEWEARQVHQAPDAAPSSPGPAA
jgi:hypothetical protein